MNIEEMSFVELGGEKQYIEITGKSDNNPVLLFIHGGPGWPQTPQLRYFNSDLTTAFTLVTWDQHGCGKTSMNNPEPKNLTLEQIIEDAHELTQILKKKFNRDKIFLAGYSWGSIVGLHLAEKYPEDYYTYVGIAQVINMRKGIEVSRKWITERAIEKADTGTLRILSQLNKRDSQFCNGDLACFIKQYELLVKYNGALYNPESGKEEEKAMKEYEDYKNYKWDEGSQFSARHLEKDMFDADLTYIRKLEIPVIFFEGRHDWNVPSVLAEEFEKNLVAPQKGLVWFEKSGHGLLYEEPAKFNKLMIENLID
jgi:pimeloyl-ACP methyl ester carboxylesterase